MPLKLKYSLLVALIVGCWYLHMHYQNKAVESVKTSLNAEYDKKLLAATNKALEVQNEMQKKADKALEDKNEEIKAIDARLASTLSELRKRPKRSDPHPTDTAVAKACTGAELYREDAEFLAREAARADRVLTERDYYYNEYESVRRRMEEASN